MVGAWPHPPGTLRALITILKGPFHIICRRCQRAAAMEVDRADLDRPYEPCPFVCSVCRTRAEIAFEVPPGFTLVTPAPRQQKPQEPEPAAPVQVGPRYTPSF